MKLNIYNNLRHKEDSLEKKFSAQIIANLKSGAS